MFLKAGKGLPAEEGYSQLRIQSTKEATPVCCGRVVQTSMQTFAGPQQLLRETLSDPGLILFFVFSRRTKHPLFGKILPFQFNRRGLNIPDLLTVILDGTVRGELAHSGLH